jgi:hypothetical protein
VTRVATLGDLARGVGGRRSRDKTDVERAQQIAALVERRRMRTNRRRPGEVRSGDAEDAVPNRERRLADDRQRRLVEQVMRLGDRAGERALDRQHPEIDARLPRRLDHRRERRQVDRERARGEDGGRGAAVTAARAWKSDRRAHRAAKSRRISRLQRAQ